MAESNSYASVVTGWGQQLTAVDRNATDLLQAEIPREKLQEILTEIRDLSAEQSALTARKQEVSKRIQILLAQGRKLSTVLRVLVREQYGNRSEKLAEFNLRPFRGRPRKTEPSLPLPE